MVRLNAAELTTRQLNLRLKELGAGDEEIEVLNPQARHNLAVGIFHPCKIRFRGSVGYYSASLLDGPEVIIEGNAGWALGENLMAGRIDLARDAGASVAASMRGGEVVVRGNVGARAGISMKGGTLVIGGDSGFLTGFMMQKGRIIVCGDAGEAVGDSMYEGVIYVGGGTGTLGNDAKTEDMNEDELMELWGILDRHGIDRKPHFTKVISAKKLYHFDSLERLEKTVV